MRRELYLECYTGISCRKLLGALLALGAEKEELEQRLTCLAQCLVSIEAQYESQGIEEVVLKNIESAYPVFKTKEETEKKIAESPWGEKTKTALYRLWEISLQSEEESFLEERRPGWHWKYWDLNSFRFFLLQKRWTAETVKFCRVQNCCRA